MPRIFDNIDLSLLPALCETLEGSSRADFCVGYFNLRGWKGLASYVDSWSGGEGQCCRLLVGMQPLPQDELREALSLAKTGYALDNQTAIRLKQRIARGFREQLAFGAPTNEDETGLRCLSAQLKSRKLKVKVFLRHPLHAKLYLAFRSDAVSPIVGFLGSSNLTFAGLAGQGELNVDVLDHDATNKLAGWFEERWNDRWCIDITKELAAIIDESWAREEAIPPYHIYIKMAYHLAQEARVGLSEFRLPSDFRKKLFEFQMAAVKIAAHHINKRGGVLIGDVVGLGKTLMATAVARIFEDDYNLETLIICPANLVEMWEDYRQQYRLRGGKVLSIGKVIRELPNLRRYRVVIIDESQNLRNREGRRYRAIHEYIRANESRCILLSATPYNKTYLDLSNQLRLFIPEDADLSIRPERVLKDVGETEFMRRHQCSLRSLAAFEKSEYADDWRELMRLFLVRRTRTFIKDNYAKTDPANGRPYLTFEDGSKSYFPERVPRTVRFTIDDRNPNDPYARLYSHEVVDTINALSLPRYGLGNYVAPTPKHPPTQDEAKVLQDLSRAGKRLMGFCRTNLFKRLESSGQAFLQSVERHILRNYVFLHAIENDKPLAIGTQDAAMLDTRMTDADADGGGLFGENDDDGNAQDTSTNFPRAEEEFKRRAEEVYEQYETELKRRFRWLRPSLFVKSLAKDLLNDAQALMRIIQQYGDWDPSKDAKLSALVDLLTNKHPDEKVIVFSQFADTVRYLATQLQSGGVQKLAGVTGDSEHPTRFAWRFSPGSNQRRDAISPENELRVLVATDVLSEGQNLQDGYIVVNYDLPWAIIRLVQRAGRVDRIGQTAENILCYSFLPAEGIERIIRLRWRVRRRLKENAEVVGADEAYFEDDLDDRTILDLYHEKAGILDDDPDTEVDLASYAYEIWNNATKADPKLAKLIPDMPPVVYSAKAHKPREDAPEGVLVYTRTADGGDALAWVNKKGRSITESPLAILKAAACSPDTPDVPRDQRHHELVRKGVEEIVKEGKFVGGQLGRPSGARFRTYERLKHFAEEVKGTLFDTENLHKVIEDVYRYPLRHVAVDTLNRQLRAGISDDQLANLAIALREEGRLSLVHEEEEPQEPQIICSMGLNVAGGGDR